MSGKLWERIVEIAGTDDPNELTYWTGMGYAQLTRYKSGKSGAVRGPAAADLEMMARTLSLRTGMRITMGQLWGVEELPARKASTSRRAAAGAAARHGENVPAVERAVGLVEKAQEPQPAVPARRAGGPKK